MKKKYVELIKNTGLFFIASFLPNVLAFFMVPLYTRCLSTADYGVVDLLFNAIQLLLPILTLQIQDAVMRFAMDEGYKKKDVFSVGLRLCVCGFLILCAGCMVLQLLGIMQLKMEYLSFLLVNFLTVSLYNMFSFFCRGIDQIKVLTVASVLNMLIFIGCNFIFLLKFQWGLNGYLVANSIGTLICVLYIFWRAKLYRYITWHFTESGVGKEMTLFSIPLIFSTISWWLNNASDRFVLNFFCGTSVVGIYTVAYKIPTILKVFGDVISAAFSISAIKEFDEKDSDGFMGKSYSMISFLVTVSCSVLVLFNIFLSKILFGGEFFEAWHYVPLLLLSVLMNQLSFSCKNILVAAKETKIISRTAVAGAVINTAANFIFIPYMGIYGAALATTIGFFCFWGLRYYRLVKIVDLKNNFKKECMSYLLLAAQSIAAYWGNRFWYIQLLLLLAILLVYRVELTEIASSVMRIRHLRPEKR